MHLDDYPGLFDKVMEHVEQLEVSLEAVIETKGEPGELDRGLIGIYQLAGALYCYRNAYMLGSALLN